MIRITVELIPRGDVANKQHLGTADIINDGTGTRRGQPTSTWKTGHLTGFPRLKFGAWDLLFMALAATIGKRMLKRAE